MESTAKAFEPFHYYKEMFARRSPEELRMIAHIKRFNECMVGDPGFRKDLTEHADDSLSLVRARGIDLDPKELSPFWRKGVRITIPREEFEAWPLAMMWRDWVADLLMFRNLMRDIGETTEIDPRFHAWRLRQIARSESELGDSTGAITHAVLSFELTKGCSVGCWFCGFRAEGLRGAFPYTRENGTLWQDVLEACVEAFGPAVNTGFCYWATEPFDNPDYLQFVKDFHRVTGVLPQTTTAVPLRDLSRTRDLMRLHNEYPSVPCRFSIRSLKTLSKVHEIFSPEELLPVELVQQQKGSIVVKARAGRLQGKECPGNADVDPSQIAPHLGTIACVSGFLVNMVERSIRLVSPCRASERWPLGYRTHAEGRFDDAPGFLAFIREAVATHMAERLEGDDVVAFRKDLTYQRNPDGFKVSTPFTAHTIKGENYLAELGDMIARGDQTVGDILGALIAQGGDVFGICGALQDLFDKGLLEDDPLDYQNRPAPSAS